MKKARLCINNINRKLKSLHMKPIPMFNE